MTTYKEAEEELNGRQSRKLENNTYLERIGEKSIGVRLHGTYVVTYMSDGAVLLNSGGWHTVTTKDRINKYSGVRVRQKKFEWYLGDGKLFHDGIEVRP